MIEIRPKIEEISTESLMLFFAECLKKYCSEKRGTRACMNCPFHKKGCGCKLTAFTPDEWGV